MVRLQSDRGECIWLGVASGSWGRRRWFGCERFRPDRSGSELERRREHVRIFRCHTGDGECRARSLRGRNSYLSGDDEREGISHVTIASCGRVVLWRGIASAISSCFTFLKRVGTGPDVAAATGIFVGGGYGGSALFGNSGTQTLEIRSIPLPPTWAGAVKLLLAVGNDQGGSGNVKIAGRVKCIVSGSNFVAPGFGSSASQTLTTNGQTFSMASISLDTSACGAGNYVDVEISRDNTVAGNYGNPVFVPSASLIVQ